MSLFNTPMLGDGSNDKKTDVLGGETAMDKMAGFVSDLASRNAGLANALMSPNGTPTEIYFPPEMIAGCGPYIEGQAQDMAWQAAAEALDSERLHIISHVHDGMVWFLAVRSADLSSHPHSWCPFASLLPGMPDAQPGPALYMYQEEGVATLLAIGHMELSIHRGSINIVQVKAERMSRDLGDAPIFNLLSERLDALTPTPWQSVSLLEDKARRFIASIGMLTGLGVAVMAFLIWVLATLISLNTSHDVMAAQKQSQVAVQELMHQALALRSSPLRNQLARFVDLNDELIKAGGWLKQYTITGTRVQWRAVMPPSITSDIITRLGGRTQEVTDEGILIVGNN